MGHSAVVTYPVPDFDHPNVERYLRAIAASVRGQADGKINTAIDIELELAPATTTVVTDERIAPTSRIVLSGGNSAGIADLNSGTVRVLDGDIVNGQFTINHVPFSGERRLRAVILT